MPVDKTTVDRLAKAWFAESKRIQTVDVPCYCGCGEIIRPRARRFRSGHDAKLLSRYTREIAEILGSN